MEQGFDKLFGYKRELTETFEYCNTMKNGSIDEQLKMQECEYVNTLVHANTQTQQHTNVGMTIQTDSPTLQQSGNFETNNSTSVQQHDNKPVEKQTIDNSNKPTITTDLGLGSVLGIFTPEQSPEETQQPTIPKKKKKKPKRGFRQS